MKAGTDILVRAKSDGSGVTNSSVLAFIRCCVSD
jgi:hypothetical protein